MKLQIGRKYITKAGNVLECVSMLGESYVCRYLQTIADHRSRANTTELYCRNGKLISFPNSDHDIEKALEKK